MPFSGKSVWGAGAPKGRRPIPSIRKRRTTHERKITHHVFTPHAGARNPVPEIQVWKMGVGM
jgi:hypothetical protein